MPRQDDQNAPGAIGAGNGRVFWWRVGEGVLDAYDLTDGRLEWSADFPELARVPVTPSNSTVAVSAGVDYAEGRVLVWGNGNAVCTERGEKVWKAAARDSDAIMPLMLKGGDDPAAEKIDRVRAAMSWTLFPLLPQSVGRTNWPRGMALSNPLGMATPAFTGVYSQSRGSTWLTWGSEGVRALNGDRFWMVDRSGVSVCHAMGIPLGSIEGRTNSARGIEVGFARGAMVMASGSVVERLDPDGEVEVLWSQNESTNRPSSHPFPAVGLDGRVLGVATRSMLRWQDAVTGTVLWEGEWPEEIEAWEPHWKTAFDEYQSVRWSSKGVWLLNDQRVSRALDWRSVMVKGHWVVPIGPSALVCLKSADDRTKVK